MTKQRFISLLMIVLVAGFVAGYLVRPLLAAVAPSPVVPAVAALAVPRASQSFAAHPDLARAIVAGCAAGTVRGGECENAQSALSSAEGRARTERFIGSRPR